MMGSICRLDEMKDKQNVEKEKKSKKKVQFETHSIRNLAKKIIKGLETTQHELDHVIFYLILIN